MKFFELVPGNFFSVLTSPNREIYYEALMSLHELFKYEIDIRLDDYLAAVSGILEDRAYVLEGDEDEMEVKSFGSGHARLVIRRLEKTGWIIKEYLDKTFIEIVTPQSYAVPFIRLLYEMKDERVHEYNSLVFASYSSLKQAMEADRDSLFEALTSAKSNMEQLQYSLRTLYHGIRQHMKAIVLQNSVNELIEDHFEAFLKMSDLIYHPLKTFDSTFRYMGPISSIIMEIAGDEELLASINQKTMKARKYKESEEASKEVMAAIDYISDSSKAILTLTGEIDRKHSAYTKTSTDKIQYLMNADQTIKGKVISLLEAYSNSRGEEREKIAEVLEAGIKVYRQRALDVDSLYHRSKKDRLASHAAMPIDDEAPDMSVAEKKLLQKMKQGYSSTKIKNYMSGLFAILGPEFTSAEIPLESDEDFIMLIMAVGRQKERGMPYEIDTDSLDRINNNGYTIPVMTIRKKIKDVE
jgi:hypothetical protein